MIARRIRAGLLAYGLSPAPAEVLSRYCDALLEQNQVMNLTAITDPEQVADLHMLDWRGNRSSTWVPAGVSPVWC